MVELRPYLVGERRRLGAAVVAGTAAVAVVWLLALRAGESALPFAAREGLFLALFGVVPAVAGGVCGHGRCGLAAAAVCGLVPGVVLALFVLAVDSFGPRPDGVAVLAAAASLASIGFVWATGGFAVGVIVAAWRSLK